MDRYRQMRFCDRAHDLDSAGQEVRYRPSPTAPSLRDFNPNKASNSSYW
jgi:hypothetical protein